MSSSTHLLELEQIFPGDSELARRMRDFDWLSTDLGPPQNWPQNLRTAVNICLTSRFPMHVWWGAGLTLFYNDAYISFLGSRKHPRVLGRSGREAWAETWDTIGPMIESVWTSGRASWSEDILMFFDRELAREEVYVTFSFSPVNGDAGKVEGLFCASMETTEKLVGNRRLETLRKLGIKAAEATSVTQACETAARVLDENPHDVPFAAIYVLEEIGGKASMVASTRLPEDRCLLPESVLLSSDVDSRWGLQSVIRTKCAASLTDIGVPLPGGPWPEPARQALVLPIRAAGLEDLAGLLVAGVSPRRPFDAGYRAFFDLVAGHIATAIVDAEAYDEERRRAEALAEIDRAKTAFFSNVSHEFRTPLTLLLGPLEDLLADNGEGVIPQKRELVETARRNAIRLLKLVNTLLDFSRIEASRIQASYQPTDLAAFTTDLASSFRSATERAGLRLVVNCASLPEPVYVDRDMWEKVVLNLLSNAFKFTLEGEISIALEPGADGVAAELTVCDTGTGIPGGELSHIFERFHRVENSRGRTYEGSGIGLSLVRDIVKLHGGDVAVESEFGKGSTFRVRIPFGVSHLPARHIGRADSIPASVRTAGAYVSEALSWLPGGAPAASLEEKRKLSSGGRVLLAEDNADMREYMCRLLRERYEVSAVHDGEQALARALAEPPDLVLTDIMMPGRDGFGLLKALRAHQDTRTIPIILLSARAGEESRVEGLQAGADDYIVKPFRGRELLARVEAHLSLARTRREVAESLRRSERSLRQALTEKEVLLKEIHHRVKNNLEVISSLLSLQADFINDPPARQILDQTCNRVHTIADIHRLLYLSPDLAHVDVETFLRRLADGLFSFYDVSPDRVRLMLDTRHALMEIEHAVPFALILNELLSNSLKHAFPENRTGTIRVQVDMTDRVMVFSDDGVGLPPDFDLRSVPSLGLQLVELLVEQIGGIIKVSSGPGTTFTIDFAL